MKLYFFLLVLLIVFVQALLTKAKTIEGSSNNDDTKHVLNKRINGLWGKRLSKLWGKRSDSESDEMYQNLLREFYDHGRRNPFSHPQYSAYNGLHPLTLKQLYAQRARLDDDNEDTSENMS